MTLTNRYVQCFTIMHIYTHTSRIMMLQAIGHRFYDAYIKIYSMSMKIYSWNRVCIDMQWSLYSL